MYTFIRKDLGEAYKIIQAGHALFEHALTLNDKPERTSHFCLLEAKDENDLMQIASKLEMKNINFTMFHEPDYDTGYTAITAGPIYGTDRKHFKKYRIYK